MKDGTQYGSVRNISTASFDLTSDIASGGEGTEVPKADIVVGDIVVLGAGAEVPADGKLLEAVSLQINESSLTGEPMVKKSVRPEDFDPEATYPTNSRPFPAWHSKESTHPFFLLDKKERRSWRCGTSPRSFPWKDQGLQVLRYHGGYRNTGKP